MDQPTPQEFEESWERATAVKGNLIEAFRKTTLPVLGLSLVLSGDGIPAVAAHLSQEPNVDEIPSFPDRRDGVAIRYYALRDGVLEQCPPFVPPSPAIGS